LADVVCRVEFIGFLPLAGSIRHVSLTLPRRGSSHPLSAPAAIFFATLEIFYLVFYLVLSWPKCRRPQSPGWTPAIMFSSVTSLRPRWARAERNEAEVARTDAAAFA
jgi:hypothetical protein